MQINIQVKKLWEYPVPTTQELKDILKLCDNDKDELYYLAFLMLAHVGCRPKELLQLTWQNLKFDEKSQMFVEITHFCYKPRRLLNKASTTLLYKCVRKPIESKVLSDRLLAYHNKISGHYASNKIFPFTSVSSLENWFKRARIKHKWLQKTISENIKGKPKVVYKISPYGMRRWCISYFYFRNHENLLLTSKTFGHSNTSTTWGSYLQTKDAIQFEDKPFDELVFNKPVQQTKIIEFYQGYKDSARKSMNDCSQTHLSNWMSEV